MKICKSKRITILFAYTALIQIASQTIFIGHLFTDFNGTEFIEYAPAFFVTFGVSIKQKTTSTIKKKYFFQIIGATFMCIFKKRVIAEYYNTMTQSFLSPKSAGNKCYEKIQKDAFRLKLLSVSINVLGFLACVFCFPILENGCDIFYTLKFFKEQFSTNIFLYNFVIILFYSSFPGCYLTVMINVSVFCYFSRHCVYQCMLLNEFIEQFSIDADDKSQCEHDNIEEQYQKEIEEKLKFSIDMSIIISKCLVIF